MRKRPEYGDPWNAQGPERGHLSNEQQRKAHGQRINCEITADYSQFSAASLDGLHLSQSSKRHSDCASQRTPERSDEDA